MCSLGYLKAGFGRLDVSARLNFQEIKIRSLSAEITSMLTWSSWEHCTRVRQSLEALLTKIYEQRFSNLLF
jgi:hypothetical protein